MVKKMILIIAPRRFGKSTNMDMMKKFLEIQVDATGTVVDKETSSNRKLFQDNDLLIYQEKEFFKQHFANYPVIHINFKNVGGHTFAAILKEFKFALGNTFKQHKYLLNSDKLDSREKNRFQLYSDLIFENLDEPDVCHGLEFLSEYLYKHFDKKKVYILIDEYDAPINNAMFEKDIDNNDVNKLLCRIFSNTLKQNKYVEGALLTGISYFASVGLSGINNIEKYMWLNDHPFIPYYGLTVKELGILIDRFKIDDNCKEEIRKYYNGYSSLSGIKLFSIWSILNYLDKRKFDSFWEKSGLITNLEEALHIPIIRNYIEKICHGESVVIRLIESVKPNDIVQLSDICLQKADPKIKRLEKPDLYLTFIFQQGYLTHDTAYEMVDNPKLRALKAPNTAIVDIFKNELEDYFGPTLDSKLEECAVVIDKIISPCSNNDIYEELLTTFQQVISEVEDTESDKNERIFHSYLFSVLCKTKFSIITDDTSFAKNKRRPDLVIRTN